MTDRGHVGREGGVQRDRGVGVHEAKAVRADHAHVVPAHLLEQQLLPLTALGPGLGEARGDDDERLDASAGAILDDLGNGRRRHRDDRQIHGSTDRRHRRIGLHRVHGRRLRVDWIDRTGELAAQQRSEDAVSDGAGITGGAHDGDRPGMKQRPKRRRGEDASLQAVRVLGQRRRSGVQPHAHVIALRLLLELEAASLKQGDDRAVVLVRYTDEHADAALDRKPGQALQQKARQALAAQRRIHRQSDGRLAMLGVEAQPGEGEHRVGASVAREVPFRAAGSAQVGEEVRQVIALDVEAREHLAPLRLRQPTEKPGCPRGVLGKRSPERCPRAVAEHEQADLRRVGGFGRKEGGADVRPRCASGSCGFMSAPAGRDGSGQLTGVSVDS